VVTFLASAAGWAIRTEDPGQRVPHSCPATRGRSESALWSFLATLVGEVVLAVPSSGQPGLRQKLFFSQLRRPNPRSGPAITATLAPGKRTDRIVVLIFEDAELAVAPDGLMNPALADVRSVTTSGSRRPRTTAMLVASRSGECHARLALGELAAPARAL
jgi:hypothetical protein